MQQYQGNTPQFGFTDSNLGGLPTTLDQINPYYYSQIERFITANGGRLASINGLVLYDTLRVDAGLMPLTSFDFFQNGLNSTQGLFVAGTQYRKQEIDIHPWVSNGRLDQGYSALIWSIQVRVQLVASLDESVQTSGNGLNLPLDPGILSGEAATDAIKMGNLMRAIQESLYFEFRINDTSFEKGPTWRFPSCYGSGNYQGVGGVIAAPFADGMVNNGGYWAYQMPVMRYIPELTRFGVRMTVQNGYTNVGTLPYRVVVILEGIGMSPVTG